MIGKIIVSSFLLIAIGHTTFANYTPDTQSIGKADNRFDINVDGKKVAYRIGHILLEYTPDKLKVKRNKDTNSADIVLEKGFVMLIYGDLVELLNRQEPYSEYTFIKNQYINVKASGSAKLAADGQHVENCKFEWQQTLPIYKNLLKDAVRDALLENLEEILGEKLCASVNKVITEYSV